MVTVHRKHAASAGGSSEPKEEAVVVSDVVTETTERIEVIEEVTPEEPKSEPPTESVSTEDPLADFKEKMSEEESLPSDEPTEKNFMWPILFVFVIAILLLGGIFVFKNTKTQKVNVVTLSPTPTLTPAPTKTVDLSKYPIKILNGSGVDGEASRQKTNLEAQGFKVTLIDNASNSNYTQTIIQAKKEVDKDFIAKLKSVLENSFTVGDADSLSDSASTPVVVILGTKK